MCSSDLRLQMLGIEQIIIRDLSDPIRVARKRTCQHAIQHDRGPDSLVIDHHDMRDGLDGLCLDGADALGAVLVPLGQARRDDYDTFAHRSFKITRRSTSSLYAYKQRALNARSVHSTGNDASLCVFDPSSLAGEPACF